MASERYECECCPGRFDMLMVCPREECPDQRLMCHDCLFMHECEKHQDTRWAVNGDDDGE